MNLFRFRIVPESPWASPWQSDTLAGLLCWTCARAMGTSALRERIIEPALANTPPFVLSDAFPGDWLPLPVAARNLDAPPEMRKSVKRAKWLSRGSFSRLQSGTPPALSDLCHHGGIREYTLLRNSLSRSTQTTAEGGQLFPTRESVCDNDSGTLTVYARIESGFVPMFWDLVGELTQWGFGADRSAGKGQFRLGSNLEPASDLDGAVDTAGCVVLSTFQPSAKDPTDGTWDTFTKYGKLGPDFGIENVFKRPMIFLRPGACFRDKCGQGWVGRAVPMSEMLADDVDRHLRAQGAEVVHWAFGLTVPLPWPQGEFRPAEAPAAVPAASAPAPEPAPNPEPPPAAPSPGQPQPSRPAQAQEAERVTVRVLEQREINGRVQFIVQEPGQRRGVLAYGVPPAAASLPQVGDDIVVYRNNRDLRTPQYRWDKPPLPTGNRRRGGGPLPPRRR